MTADGDRFKSTYMIMAQRRKEARIKKMTRKFKLCFLGFLILVGFWACQIVATHINSC